MYAPVVPLKTIPDSRTKWAKCFQTKKAQTPYPSIIEESTTPDPDPFHDCQRPRQGLKMGEENSILIRLMIQIRPPRMYKLTCLAI